MAPVRAVGPLPGDILIARQAGGRGYELRALPGPPQLVDDDYVFGRAGAHGRQARAR